MDKSQSEKIVILLLRLVMGWLFLYAGLTKVLDPNFSAAGYLAGAKTFAGFYSWLASPAILPIINFLNEWGLTLLGISLILGIGVRFSSILGALLMLLYYLPILRFPYPDPHSFIVDEHIVYIFVLIYFAVIRAGQYYGLENWCGNLAIFRNSPGLKKWWG